MTGPGFSSSQASGSQVVTNLNPGGNTYTITASGSGGSASNSVTVTVASPLSSGALGYPRSKYVGVYYMSWFGSNYPWSSVWGGNIVTPTTLGRYVSNSTTGATHAARLKQLGVDFMAIDSTNNTIWGPAHPNPDLRNDAIFNAATAVASGFGSTGMKAVMLLSIGNSRGGSGSDAGMEQLLTQNYSTANPPTMVYPNIPSNAGDLFRAKVARVYNELANDPSKYFYYEGKPLLLLYTTASGTIFGPSGQNATPNGKLEGTDLLINIPGVSGNPLLTDLFTIRWVGALVSNSGNPAYVSAPDQTIAKNGHWSWEDGHPQSWAQKPTGWLSDVFPETVTVSASSRAYGSNAVAGRVSGTTFRNQWSRAWAVDPVITMVHTWNEFSSSGDEPSSEYSQSIEANNIFGNSYETYLSNYAAFLRSLRYDVGLYDLTGRAFRLYNRKDDYQASNTTVFGYESLVTMNRGDPVQTLSGDFNKDGLFEIGLRNTNDGTVALRFSPRFTVGASGGSPAEVVVTLDAGTAWQIFAGDFNNDGFCDLGLYNTSSRVWKFYHNDGAYGFVFSHQFTWDAGGAAQVAGADVNADGRCDLLVRTPGTGVITIGLNNGDGLQSSPGRVYTVNLTQAAGTQYQFYAADFSGDGAAEIGVRDSSSGQFFFWQNSRSVASGVWNFGAQSTFNGPVGSQYLPIIGDFR